MNTVAKGCRAISLIKGIEFNERGPILISNMIKVRPSESAPPHATARRHATARHHTPPRAATRQRAH